MRVLALEPYYGGSHKAFLDGWSQRSRHRWTLLSLPAYKWKWRMRHAAVTLADSVCERQASGETWDRLFCSDMLNLAEFLGLAPPAVRRLPSVAYLHENQLTYPVRHAAERDNHFAFTNLTTALAATQVWFNSAFHRDSFLDALWAFLAAMPDHQPLAAVDRIRVRSHVYPPGIIGLPPPKDRRRPGPIRILWAARWEHDKNPEAFFEALAILKARGTQFRLNVVGECFSDVPAVFGTARERFHEHIDRWGYQESRKSYEAALVDSDVVVSTAAHEFFGISIVEAMAAGAYPLLPRRLSYPEILACEDVRSPDEFLHEGGAEELAERLVRLADRVAEGNLWESDRQQCVRCASRFAWSRLVPCLDAALEAVQNIEA